MDREEVRNSLQIYETFAAVSPPGPDRERFQAVVDDLNRQLQAMDAEDQAARVPVQ